LRQPSKTSAENVAQAPEEKVVVLDGKQSVSSRADIEQRNRKASNEFVEAVLIALFTREMSKPEFPLGHLRQNKLVYFAHRRADEDVAERFSKLAAGPYSPWATYKGPEGIAQRNGYVKRAKVGNRVGFLVGDNIANIDQYVTRYPVCATVEWVVSHFRFKKNEELELFATVDFAALDLISQSTPITMENVKHVIATNKEWTAKLQREVFSDANINEALGELRRLFPSTYA
jgi:type I restriction enzyme, S subunit